MKALNSFMLVSLLCMFCNHAIADDRPFPVSNIPVSTTNFISQHFPGSQVSHAKKDGKTYEVYLNDGKKIEFDNKWQWKEIDANFFAVPTALVPNQIQDYVARQHPNQKILKIEKDKKGYEVKLDSGLEIKFNQRFQAVKYDD
jgi:hypothetical protein